MRCISSIIATVCLLVSGTAQADDRWTFDEKIAVGSAPVEGVFHHLEGAGRKHIAVSGNRVGVVWEDNSSNDPQVYMAVKGTTDRQFAPVLSISSGLEAYEPAIAGLADGGFIVVYEQDAAVYARSWQASGLSAPLRLSAAASSATQASIAADSDGIATVWRERQNGRYRLYVARLALTDGELRVIEQVPVEPEWLERPVLMPTIVTQQNKISVAWEDRRAGHTRILTAATQWPQMVFFRPQNLNEFFSNRNEYDKGNGVTRVSLAAFAEDEVIAAWMDKRRSSVGYGIFASLGFDGGASFGPNEKVHGAKGDAEPHYNPAVAGNLAGRFLVAWDDFRNGDLDVWISGYNEDDEWSEDHAPAMASGAGEQSHPAIALDEQGRLHLLWIERADPLAPTRLWYTSANPAGG